jgi:hypothetical protein
MGTRESVSREKRGRSCSGANVPLVFFRPRCHPHSRIRPHSARTPPALRWHRCAIAAPSARSRPAANPSGFVPLNRTRFSAMTVLLEIAQRRAVTQLARESRCAAKRVCFPVDLTHCSSARLVVFRSQATVPDGESRMASRRNACQLGGIGISKIRNNQYNAASQSTEGAAPAARLARSAREQSRAVRSE